jgi:hypothetical protein
LKDSTEEFGLDAKLGFMITPIFRVWAEINIPVNSAIPLKVNSVSKAGMKGLASFFVSQFVIEAQQ